MTKTKINEVKSDLLREKYYEIEHRSGLKIIVFPKDRKSTYAVFATKYGSMDTEFRVDGGEFVTVTDGVAHFLEHKLFENPDGSDSFANFSKYGADSNAYTSYDRTAFLFNCTEHFGECLTELLTFVTTPYFTPATVQKEQGIIAEEIRMYADDPGEKCHLNLMRSLYSVCPVNKDVCGTEQSISLITDKLLYDCYHTFYQLSNMVLIVCGKTTPDEVLSICDKVLPSECHDKKIERKIADEPSEIVRNYVSCRMPVAKPLMEIGIKDNYKFRDVSDIYARSLQMGLLTEMYFTRSGDLYNNLFNAGKIDGFSATYTNSDRCSYFNISAIGDNPQDVTREIYAYLSHILEVGIDDSDFERAKRVMYAGEFFTYDSTEEIANDLISYAFDNQCPFDQPKNILAIQKSDVENALRDLLAPQNWSLSVVYQEED